MKERFNTKNITKMVNINIHNFQFKVDLLLRLLRRTHSLGLRGELSN